MREKPARGARTMSAMTEVGGSSSDGFSVAGIIAIECVPGRTGASWLHRALMKQSDGAAARAPWQGAGAFGTE